MALLLERLFGLNLPEPKKEEMKTPVVKTNEDGSLNVQAGGFLQQTGQFGSAVSPVTDFQLITQYRAMALFPETDWAVDDIVNEAIVMENNEQPVKIDLSKVDLSDSIKKKIHEEFDNILNLPGLNFKEDAYDIFRRWYVDGRLYYHIMIPDKEMDSNGNVKKSNGIKEVRYIDPRQIRKVRVHETKIDEQTKAEIVEIVDEYYIYNPHGLRMSGPTVVNIGYTDQTLQGIKMSVDSVAYIHSGLTNEYSQTVLSHLHKAIKPHNQLKWMEDALVIYRIARAPERRIFYIDVGSMPNKKAEAHLKKQMAQYRTKLIYDTKTGEIKDDKRHLSMLEDFWMARREGSSSTSIDTLPGGENLGKLDDIEYFQVNLYKALNVPFSRLNTNTGFVLGRSTEISRDENKFNKFIYRLRLRFSGIFNQLLKTQLILKGIIKENEWASIQRSICYRYATDNYFAELKRLEIMNERMDVLDRIEAYSEKYYSQQYIKDNILNQTIEEQDKIQKEIADQVKGDTDPNELPLSVPGGLPNPDTSFVRAKEIEQELGLDQTGDELPRFRSQVSATRARKGGGNKK